MISPRKQHKSFWWCWLLSAALTISFGILFYIYPLGGFLWRLSYDFPFLFRASVPKEIVMVYLDSKVKSSLSPNHETLSRKFHQELVDKLREDGARLILFDFLFDEPSWDPGADEAFAGAMEKHGKVILVADYVANVQGTAEVSAAFYSPIPPIPTLKKSAAGWGLAVLAKDPDYAIRKIHPGVDDLPSSDWVAASILGADVTRNPANRIQSRWLNYYGPPGTLKSVSYDHALMDDGLPKGFFQDKIVVVGSRPTPGKVGAERDEFRNPYSRFGAHLLWQGHHSAGADIHAITILNLLHKDWLETMSYRGGFWFIVGYGFFTSYILLLYSPARATFMALLCAGFVLVFSVYSQLQNQLWWAWAIPVLVQTPLAYTSSVIWHFMVETLKRLRLRKAFSAYLSPYMADRIAASETDLALGGKVVEGTVLFSDLENFTAISEGKSPAEVSTLLTNYFNRCTKGILDEDGTIIKYIGDAVLAVWGAPMPTDHPVDRSLRAACQMIESGREQILGHTLRTRIGINSGSILAGNLGSTFRFDYTVIGDTVNVAARLEGLNKILGTDILISESSKALLTEPFRIRCCGTIVLQGKSIGIQVFEVLGVGTITPREESWIRHFSDGLEHFKQGSWEEAKKKFQLVAPLRGIPDGPSEFYLMQIELMRSQPKDPDWNGWVKVIGK